MNEIKAPKWIWNPKTKMHEPTCRHGNLRESCSLCSESDERFARVIGYFFLEPLLFPKPQAPKHKIPRVAETLPKETKETKKAELGQCPECGCLIEFAEGSENAECLDCGHIAYRELILARG